LTRLTLQGERRSLRDLAYSSLRAAIIDLQIAPGESLTEESMSADLGVSRPVLRESIQRLQSEGLMERGGNGRLRVTPVDAADVRHLYAVRSSLEQLAVEGAAEKMTSEVLVELRDSIARMRVAEGQGAPDRVNETGSSFHSRLAILAANPINDQMMHLIRGRIDRYRSLSIRAEARTTHSVSEHEAIFEALRTGDVVAAKSAMDVHIKAARDAVLQALGAEAAVRTSAS
jgi:DNA-binding GntR family transcriptional regulator